MIDLAAAAFTANPVHLPNILWRILRASKLVTSSRLILVQGTLALPKYEMFKPTCLTDVHLAMHFKHLTKEAEYCGRNCQIDRHQAILAAQD